ncbi:hypothetical protein JXR93_01675 [bacterium]|nr:hypothetical protein [bacterium]
MKIKEILSRGFRELRRKNEIRKLQKELIDLRTILSSHYEELGKKITKTEDETGFIKDLFDSLGNVQSVIKNLEKENSDFQKKIDVKKEEYDKRIEDYNPLIEELKEQLVSPKTVFITKKEELDKLKLDLRDTKNILKNKERIFKNNEEILLQKNDENLLNEEKLDSLKEEQERIQKEILELTQNFEEKSRTSETLKEEIVVIENEIKTAETQITTYRREMARLKKEKIKEIDTLKKLISNNNISIEMRKKELSHVFMNLGNNSYEERIQEDRLQNDYIKIDELQKRIQQISENKHLNSIESEREESFILFKFFGVVLLFLSILFFTFWLVFSLGSSSETTFSSISKTKEKTISLSSQDCSSGVLKIVVPTENKGHYAVQSDDFFTKTEYKTDYMLLHFYYNKPIQDNKRSLINLYQDKEKVEEIKIEISKDDNTPSCYIFTLVK